MPDGLAVCAHQVNRITSARYPFYYGPNRVGIRMSKANTQIDEFIEPGRIWVRGANNPVAEGRRIGDGFKGHERLT
jgi:hypothetical protein